MESLGSGDWRIGLAVYPDDNCEGIELIELARRRAAPWRVENAAGRRQPMRALDESKSPAVDSQELSRSA
jgi:hypothetical protein